MVNQIWYTPTLIRFWLPSHLWPTETGITSRFSRNLSGHQLHLPGWGETLCANVLRDDPEFIETGEKSFETGDIW